MTGSKTTAGKGVVQMAKVVADILRLIAELRPPPVTVNSVTSSICHALHAAEWSGGSVGATAGSTSVTVVFASTVAVA